MKTLTTILAISLIVTGLRAQTNCEAFITSTVSGTTAVTTGTFFSNGQQITDPTLVDYVWVLENNTYYGQTITNTFIEDGVYPICLTATGMGCTATICDSIWIGDPPLCNLIVNYNIINATDDNTADGSIDITVSNGTAPYSYFWDGGQFTEDLSGLYPGVYTVHVADMDNCTNTWSFCVIGTVVDSVTNDSFYANLGYSFLTFDDCTATVEAYISGGTAPYSYLWSNGETDASVENACGGDSYCVTITDADSEITQACVTVQYYTYDQDTNWTLNGTLSVTIDNCFPNVVSAQVISFDIQGSSVIAVWELIDDQNNSTFITVTYSLNDVATQGIYVLNLYINCGNFKSISFYSSQIIVTSEDLTSIIENISATKISVYPNPVTDILNLEIFTETNEIIEISILNISGQIVSKETYEIYGGLNNFTIDVSDYQGGMYFMHINGNSKFETIRFVK
ncbi:MAG: T9SS type A sorting domain-containing protein [Bacteroidales bacterium]|nr:T9SS type A sorting domain-containing protein [Bacteroidales bacterium]